MLKSEGVAAGCCPNPGADVDGVEKEKEEPDACPNIPGAVAGLEPNSGVDEVFGNEAPKDGVLDSCPNPNDAVCTFTMLTVHNCANYDRRNI